MTAEPGMRRRAFLATAAAGGTAATAGCIGELRNILGRQPSRQLALTITTAPDERDPFAIRIANHLGRNLQASGIDARVEPKDQDVLLRDVLMNHDFDIYVGRYPGDGTPLTLWELLNSQFAEEMGWQNPFGFSNLQVNETLEEMLASRGGRLREIVADLQRTYVHEQPFTTIAFPDFVSAHRTDRFRRWPRGGFRDPTSFMSVGLTDADRPMSLVTSDARITRNRNPLAAEHRGRGTLTGLLYEPLVRVVDGDPVPWLARSIEFSRVDDRTLASVRLRSTPWHDGRPVTAADVRFTFRFLNDTSLDELDSAVPTPRNRGRASLVSGATVHSEGEVDLTIETSNEQLARRALECPVLPEHVWADRTGTADVAGIDLVGATTEAHVWDNEETIGSGPVRFEEAAADESLDLVRFDDHFLHVGRDEGIPSSLQAGIESPELHLEVVPSHDVAVELLTEDQGYDATADTLDPSVIPRVGRTHNVSLGIAETTNFYHVGYNCRAAPLSDPNFRQVVARHLDRTVLIEDAFQGYGVPTECPLATEWVPEDLRWDGEGVQTFLGEDGEIDVPAAREAFLEAGYRYVDDKLVRRGSQ